ncbi:MAG: peptidylprolyl isomerase [Winogradskyella sp.]|uniref:peptidylprolyl isomerase n=1 Tax=Winogradskyella sp. TaxID=1883156 RepID=UPI0025FE8CD0|nr:peptidylprolyl isomerase [Winogradskyella sp.]NRB59035.1 peptidylprolyl isomerase [Winogradskyella sp.]
MRLLFITLLIIPCFSLAQESLEKEIDSINTEEQAKSYIKEHKAAKGKFYVFNKQKHKTRLASDLFKLSKGGTKVVKTEFKKTYYKIIDKEKVTHYRASYIFFDGSKLSKEEIDAKRRKIISQYQQGYKFSRLAEINSMDINAKRGGDLGWFPEGEMHPEFEEALLEHDNGDIFTLDIEEKKWHYVILKTHDAKDIEEIKVLKLSETNN